MKLYCSHVESHNSRMRYNRCKRQVQEMMRSRLLSHHANSPVHSVKDSMAGDICWALDATLNKCGNKLRTCFAVPDIRNINHSLLNKMKVLLDSIKVSESFIYAMNSEITFRRRKGSAKKSSKVTKGKRLAKKR